MFYVIEAQWRLPKSDSNEQEMISKWGFVKEEVSHTKAIIRNIQRDQRWYTFRVAAVTRHGHSIFSTTTKPFRLSSETSRFSYPMFDYENFSHCRKSFGRIRNQNSTTTSFCCKKFEFQWSNAQCNISMGRSRFSYQWLSSSYFPIDHHLIDAIFIWIYLDKLANRK